MAGIKLSNIDKRYGSVDVIRNFGLEVEAGEFLVFLGPSGCGKSPLLRMIAGRIAQETAKLMRWVDPSVELAAGSSKHHMSTFGTWEDTVLEHCFYNVDFISLHEYFENRLNSTAEFLANIDQFDLFIKEVIAVADSVAARKKSHKRIMLSIDEWNVRYKARAISDKRKPDWAEAPSLIEEIYNHEDALAVGGFLIVMMNNADRVKTACMAQLVNVIGPIMTEPGGAAWRQTILHPFAQASRFAHGRVLQSVVQSPCYEAETFPQVPYLCACVVHDDSTGQTAIFALNRHLSEEQEITIELRGLGARQKLVEASELYNSDLKAVNTAAAPDTVSPRPNTGVEVDGHRVTARFKPGSWNVIVTSGVKSA